MKKKTQRRNRKEGKQLSFSFEKKEEPEKVSRNDSEISSNQEVEFPKPENTSKKITTSKEEKKSKLKEVINTISYNISELLEILLFNPILTFFAIIIIIALFFNIKRGLTPAHEIAKELHEKSQYKSNCIMCKDGWISYSRGRGTCSHHGGIKKYIKEGEYSRSMYNCMEEAKTISWID